MVRLVPRRRWLEASGVFARAAGELFAGLRASAARPGHVPGPAVFAPPAPGLGRGEIRSLGCQHVAAAVCARVDLGRGPRPGSVRRAFAAGERARHSVVSDRDVDSGHVTRRRHPGARPRRGTGPPERGATPGSPSRRARLGRWDWDIPSNQASWSQESTTHAWASRMTTRRRRSSASGSLVHPDDRQMVSRAVIEAIEHSGVLEVEFRAADVRQRPPVDSHQGQDACTTTPGRAVANGRHQRGHHRPQEQRIADPRAAARARAPRSRVARRRAVGGAGARHQSTAGGDSRERPGRAAVSRARSTRPGAGPRVPRCHRRRRSARRGRHPAPPRASSGRDQARWQPVVDQRRRQRRRGDCPRRRHLARRLAGHGAHGRPAAR